MEVLIDVCIAGFLIFIIGLERELEGKPAGIRTNLLIGISSLLFVYLGPYLVDYFTVSIEGGSDALKVDPLRLLEATVVGVSFVGAGAIIKQEKSVEHLTTAATLLLSACIGIAVALHLYDIAVGVTIIVLIINALVWRMYKWWRRDEGAANSTDEKESQ